MVTQDVNAAVASLTLGDGTGSPTLTNAGHTLTLFRPKRGAAPGGVRLGGGSLAGEGCWSSTARRVDDGQVAHATAVTVAAMACWKSPGSRQAAAGRID